MKRLNLLKSVYVALAMLLAGLLCACQTAAEHTEATISVTSAEFHFSDGGHAISYALQKPGGHVPANAVQNLLFVIPGSDCISMAAMLPAYFKGLEGDSGRTQIYILQKRHIHPYSRVSYCGEAFTRDDHLQQWLSDQAEFILATLKLHRDAAAPQRVILMGISEGAETATMLAQHLPISHLVLLAHSGKAPLQVYRELAQSNQNMEQAWQTLNAALNQSQLDEQTLVHGRSLRYWREIQTMAQTETLIKLSIPVLIAAGGQDPVMPVGTDAFLAELNQKSQGRIQVLWFARADHALRHPEHAYLPDFMYLLEQWLRQDKQVINRGFLALE